MPVARSSASRCGAVLALVLALAATPARAAPLGSGPGPASLELGIGTATVTAPVPSTVTAAGTATGRGATPEPGPAPASPAPAIEPPSPPPLLSSVRTAFHLDARLAVDTAFDLPGEQVAALWLGARFELELPVSRSVVVFVAPRVQIVSAVDRQLNDRHALYLVTPETRVTWSFGPFDLRVGTLVFSWGASDIIAPSDVLNPIDYRRSFFTALDDNKIPVLAAELVTRLGPLTLRGVVEPFFTPSRFYLTGWDTALLQPSQAPAQEAAVLGSLLGNATLDQVGDRLLVDHPPPERPGSGTFGARGTLNALGADISLTAVHGWEPLPQIIVNPDLIGIASAFASAVAGHRPVLIDDRLLTQLASLQSAIKNGQAIFDGHYQRRDLVGFDVVYPLDPFVLKIDTSYTFARSYYTQDFRPITNPWISSVVGLEYARGEQLEIELEAFTLAILGVHATDRLAYIEASAPPPSTTSAAGRTIAFPGLTGLARWNPLEGDLRLELGWVASLTRGDLVLLPAIRYRIDDTQTVSVGAMLVEGHADGYGGAYHHDSEVYLKYQWNR